MQVTLYHNPRCGTSRKVLEYLQTVPETEIRIVEYLRTPPDRETLVALGRDSGGGLRGLLREKENLAAELALTGADVTDETLVEAMLAYPVLINRPIVVTERGTRLCRPAEKVEEVLPR